MSLKDHNQNWITRLVACYEINQATPSRIAEGAALRYKYRPKSVYKYRKNDDYARENLKNNLVWLSKPSAFNDPYDSGFSIGSDEATRRRLAVVISLFFEALGDQEEARKIRKILATPSKTALAEEMGLGLQEALSNPKAKQAAGYLVDSFLELHKASARKTLQELGDRHKEQLRISCFSTNPESVIMWSHYADNHRGFCVEYHTGAMQSTSPFVQALFPVVYSEQFFDGTEFIARAFTAKPINLQYLVLAALYKSPEWAYEQEWRLVVPAWDQHGASAFETPKPSRVYLGSLMEQSDRDAIVSICESKGIEVYKVHRASDAFRLFSEKV